MAVELPTQSRIVESRVANRQTSVMTDRWPRTRRPLPWLLALFLVLVYLVPIDVIQLPINLPVGSDLDRCVITFIVVIWLLVAAKRSGEVRLKRSAMNVGLYLFLVTCLLSVMVNLHSLNFSGELSLSVKQLALLFSYVALFYVTSSSVRPDEIESFARLIIGLGVITAIGTIYEFRSGTNLFFTLSHDVLGHLVPPAPKAHLSYEIAAVTGPTQHGLADGTIMGAGIPFAATFGTRPGDPRGRIKWLVAIILLVMGCVATQRKTALLVPIVSILVLVVMEPRRYLRYWPLLIVGLMAMEAIAPTAVSGLRYQFSITATSNATSGRTEDYAAVFPDIVNHLLFGRGYNSYYPIKYRFLDNQMLDFLIETGAFGLLSFIGLIASSAASVWREARHGTAQERTLMAPVVANAAMFFVTAFLYDVLGFRQAPYLFLFVAALGVAYVAPGRTASRTLVSASPTVTA
jgi:O-antigen ligase